MFTVTNVAVAVAGDSVQQQKQQQLFRDHEKCQRSTRYYPAAHTYTYTSIDAHLVRWTYFDFL